METALAELATDGASQELAEAALRQLRALSPEAAEEWTPFHLLDRALAVLFAARREALDPAQRAILGEVEGSLKVGAAFELIESDPEQAWTTAWTVLEGPRYSSANTVRGLFEVLARAGGAERVQRELCSAWPRLGPDSRANAAWAAELAPHGPDWGTCVRLLCHPASTDEDAVGLLTALYQRACRGSMVAQFGRVVDKIRAAGLPDRLPKLAGLLARYDREPPRPMH